MIKKRLVLLIFAAIVLIIWAVIVFAIWNINGVKYYTKILPNGSVRLEAIKNYNDSAVLTIPTRLNGRIVSEIAAYAFEFDDFSVVKSLVLPDGITEIYTYEFSNLTSLEEVTIGNNIREFNASAFIGTNLTKVNLTDENKHFSILDGCLVKYVSSDKTDIVLYFGNHIPEGVTKIADYALSGRSFRSVSIPESVYDIGSYAFYCCPELESVTVPGNVIIIRDWAFGGCSALKRVVLEQGVQIICNSVWENCQELSFISIPQTVTEIGKAAFRLTGFDRVPELGGITTMEAYLFYNCPDLVHADIPEGIQEVSPLAFGSCYKLKSVSIPSSVRIIGDGAFVRCDSLEELALSFDNINYYFDGDDLIDIQSNKSVLNISRFKQ